MVGDKLTLVDRENTARAVEKCRNGQSITDCEIKSALVVLPVIIDTLLLMGLQYQLVVSDLRRKLHMLEDFMEARTEARKCN